MHFVKNAKYVSEYKLLLSFEDQSVRLVDLEPHLDGEIFELLKDIYKGDSRLIATVNVIPSPVSPQGERRCESLLSSKKHRLNPRHLTI